jgi:hypothetical protein
MEQASESRSDPMLSRLSFLLDDNHESLIETSQSAGGENAR